MARSHGQILFGMNVYVDNEALGSGHTETLKTFPHINSIQLVERVLVLVLEESWVGCLNEGVLVIEGLWFAISGTLKGYYQKS